MESIRRVRMDDLAEKMADQVAIVKDLYKHLKDLKRQLRKSMSSICPSCTSHTMPHYSYVNISHHSHVYIVTVASPFRCSSHGKSALQLQGGPAAPQLHVVHVSDCGGPNRSPCRPDVATHRFHPCDAVGDWRLVCLSLPYLCISGEEGRVAFSGFSSSFHFINMLHPSNRLSVDTDGQLDAAVHELEETAASIAELREQFATEGPSLTPRTPSSSSRLPRCPKLVVAS